MEVFLTTLIFLFLWTTWEAYNAKLELEEKEREKQNRNSDR